MKPNEVILNHGLEITIRQVNLIGCYCWKSGYTEDGEMINSPDENLFIDVIGECIENQFHVKAYRKIGKILGESENPFQAFNDIAFLI